MVVADDEGHFGFAGVGFGPVVSGYADDVFVEGGHQGHTTAAVHVGEALDLGRAETGVSPEKAQVDGVGREMGVERDQPGAVVGGDGPDVDGRPVGQDRVAFPGGGVDHGGYLSVVRRAARQSAPAGDDHDWQGGVVGAGVTDRPGDGLVGAAQAAAADHQQLGGAGPGEQGGGGMPGQDGAVDVDPVGVDVGDDRSQRFFDLRFLVGQAAAR